jgi:outer membrane cobalamin receptor
MDNTRVGNVEQLRQISVSSISAVRYFSASEAQTKWGSGHAGGVIEVLTKR